MNLENFPTSPAAKRMLKTVSPIYDNAYVAKWMFHVMGLEIDEAWQFIEELRLQAFPETATWGIVYWEQQYHIPPDESLSIEERRRRVIIKRGKRKPMNPARIEKLTRDITGRQAVVTERNEEYVFFIAILPGESEVDYQELINTIRSVKPSHLTPTILFQTDVTLTIQATSQEKYSFGYTLAGTIPDINTVGALSKKSLILGAEMEGHPFEYTVSGTGNAGEHPDTNTIGAIRENNFELNAGIEGYPFDYETAGTGDTGEHPQTNTIGSIGQGAFIPKISATKSTFNYELCGETEREL
jgi:hypothetical protein